MKAFLCTFSGNPKAYVYTADEGLNVQRGDRVVVPTKMAKDGHLSMSIVTVEAEVPQPEGYLLPILALIPHLAIMQATELVKAKEAATGSVESVVNGVQAARAAA